MKRFAGKIRRALRYLSIPILALALIDCTPAEMQKIQTAVKVADDIAQIARVLCLADHARQAHTRALTVQDLCKDEAQLAPYIPQARGSIPKAACQ